MLLICASFIGASHHTFGSVPWPQQFGECGQKGTKLHVPYNFFDNLRGNLRRKCNLFDCYLNLRHLIWDYSFVASMLLKSFCKYQFGVFEEEGYLHDSLYPLTFIDGNKTQPNRGCRADNITLLHEFCPLGQIYDRYAPTKQNLLCLGSSAFDIILNHDNFQNQQMDSFQPLFKHKSIGVRKTFRNPT